MRAFLPIAWLLGLALLVVGCSSGGFSERASEGKENVFRYPIVTAPTTLDPHMVTDGDTIDALLQVYEPLVMIGEENEVVPVLAESWEISEDGTVYTFQLKEGVQFHSGREMTAEDVKWSIDRATNPALASNSAAGYLSDIVGVEERVRGEADTVEGVQATGPYEVQVTLKKPTPYFLGKFSFLSAAVLDSENVPFDREMRELDEMIGTGGFTMAQYQPNQIIVQNAFDGYHGGRPNIDQIERPILLDAVTRLNKYRNGEVDLVMLERQDVAGLQQDPDFENHLQFFPRPSTWYIGMNPNYAPFDDRRVRRAVGMAVDRETIVNQMLGGVNQVANSIVPPGLPGGDRESAESLQYNPAQARQLLAEAGYPNGEGFPELEMTFREGRPDVKIVAESVAAMLKENLNVDVVLRPMEWGAYLDRYYAGEQRFYHMRWGADYLDPQNFLSYLLRSDSPQNFNGYSNPEFDALVSEADSLMDEDRRLALYAEAEDIALQDAPWVPIYFQRDAELISPEVQGLRESILGHLPHTEVELNRAAN